MMQNSSGNVSNQYGRALEYAIVAEIARRRPQNQTQLTSRAYQDQVRDFRNYESLSVVMQQSYQRCASRVFDWLNQNFSVSNGAIQIDRLPDSVSKQGDVTDIRISTALSTINLSIKHNHKALKHQRPGSTAQHCGFLKNSQEDADFRANYKEIAQNFLLLAKGYSRFSDLGQRTVLDNLYIPVCDLVSKFINQSCLQQASASHLFSFLVGKIDFYKIIFNERENLLIIEEFSQLAMPTSVTAQAKQSYVYLDFSNSWKVSMRLHTASSRISSNPSLKFDTQPVQIVVPKETFNI